ncbi:MAG: alpha-E domain-containing protein, partial [Rhodobacteraceae bacterium]|nr:alpha-E domain-containing protein [Paracoccaceae bacterium]
MRELNDNPMLSRVASAIYWMGRYMGAGQDEHRPR